MTRYALPLLSILTILTIAESATRAISMRFSNAVGLA